jgi:hypothetical protein
MKNEGRLALRAGSKVLIEIANKSEIRYRSCRVIVGQSIRRTSFPPDGPGQEENSGTKCWIAGATRPITGSCDHSQSFPANDRRSS